MKKYHVKKGDTVVVNSGEWKSEVGKVVAVLSKKDRVVLEFTGLNDEKRNRIGKKTVKKSRTNPNGGLVDRAVSVHVSNVTLKVEEATKE